MPPITDALRECHRLRKHLRELALEIERGPRVLKIRQEKLEAERAAHKEHHDSITKLKLRLREDEGTLKQTEQRLAKLEAQLTGISVPKEYAAKESEIAQAKEKQGALEDAILQTIGEIEAKTAAVPQVEQQWAEAQTELAEFQKEAAERLERLKAEHVASLVALEKAEEGIPEDNRSRYDQYIKAHGPEAFAAVKNRICQGCRTALTEQRELDVRHGTFLLCSTCGKMLYVITV